MEKVVKICDNCEDEEEVFDSRLCKLCWIARRLDKRITRSRACYDKRNPQYTRTEYFIKENEPPLCNIMSVTYHPNCEDFIVEIDLDGFTDWQPAQIWGFTVMNRVHLSRVFMGDYRTIFRLHCPKSYLSGNRVRYPKYLDELGG